MLRSKVLRSRKAIGLLIAITSIISGPLLLAATPASAAYSGPWASSSYGPTSPGSGSVTPDSDFDCTVTVSDVDQLDGNGTPLSIYGAQFCSGDYAPERVGTSIWRARWWGGQQVAGWNYSAWTSNSLSDASSTYDCANSTGYFTYFGYAYGYAQEGLYGDEVESLDSSGYYCG